MVGKWPRLQCLRLLQLFEISFTHLPALVLFSSFFALLFNTSVDF